MFSYPLLVFNIFASVKKISGFNVYFHFPSSFITNFKYLSYWNFHILY